jgi:transposase
MFDVHGELQGGFVGVDDRPVSGGRRRWLATEKAQILAELRMPGARVSEVARRWQICSQQIYRWRHAETARRRSATSPQPEAAEFVPIVTDARPSDTTARAARPAAVIEVKLAGAVVRVCGLDDAAPLTAVLRAIRASASRA